MTAGDYRERIFSEDIEDLVREILRRFNRPYPEDITDKVFLTIEHNQEYLRLYKLYAGEDTSAANPMIGKMVKELTGLKVKGKCSNPESSLIKSYTKLGY